ncbi:hypothetical protein E2320_014434, partial [Naja naja]
MRWSLSQVKRDVFFPISEGEERFIHIFSRAALWENFQEDQSQAATQEMWEAVTEYPKGGKIHSDLLKSCSLGRTSRKIKVKMLHKSRKLSLDLLESPLCAGAEGLDEPLLK